MSKPISKCSQVHSPPRLQGPVDSKSPGTPESSRHCQSLQLLTDHSAWAAFSVFLSHPFFLFCLFLKHVYGWKSRQHLICFGTSSYETGKKWSKTGKIIRINICKDFPWNFIYLYIYLSIHLFIHHLTQHTLMHTHTHAYILSAFPSAM